MRVESWFKLFAARHIERHPRDDWPRLSDAPDFYAGWQGNFKLHGVDEATADEASVRLMADPPPFRDRHVNALIEQCKAIWRERADACLGGVEGSREAAERASKDCDDCRGQGFATRWRRLSVGTTDEQGRPRAPYIYLYCRCPLGRYMEKAHREGARDIRMRMHDLEEHPWLWGYEYRRPPGVEADEVAEAPAY